MGPGAGPGDQDRARAQGADLGVGGKEGVDRLHDHRGGVWPIAGLLGQQPGDQGSGARADVGGEALEIGGLAAVGVEQGEGRGRREGQVAAGHLVEDAAEGIEVGARVDGQRVEALGGHVIGCAEHRHGLPVDAREAGCPGHAEVGDLGDLGLTWVRVWV